MRASKPLLQRAVLALAAVCVIGMLAAIAPWDDVPAGSAVGMMQRRAGSAPAASTPVAVTPRPHDPLDGDPLDGRPGGADSQGEKPPRDDVAAPENQDLLEIVRSGRPSEEPRSLSAYDGDPSTVWRPETTDESWIWFDLGAEQGVREVRWLAEGPGDVVAAVSTDRRRWRSIEPDDADGDWQGATLRDDVRFVRLTLIGPTGEEAPGLAEVAVYGRDRGADVSIAQEADGDRERRRDRASRDDEGNSRRAETAADDEEAASGGTDRTRRGGGRVQISAEAGETRCSGDRERCRARQGEVSVEEDCADEGSCVIDIRADGGTAVCDATGGEESRAGRGEGRRGADGGSCEAVANGGAVAIGDINP